MALGQTFDLASIYGAAENLKTRRVQNDLLDQQAGLQKLMQDTGRQAIDPQTGEYSAAQHARALTAAGYPQAGQEVLGRSIDYLEKTNKYVEGILPRLNAATYPAVKAQMEKAGMVPPGYMPDAFNQAWVDDQLIRLGRQLKDSYGAFEELYRAPDGTVVVGQRGTRTGEVANVQKLTPPKPEKPRVVKPQEVQFADGTTGFVNPETGEPMLAGMRPVPRSGSGAKPPSGYRYTSDGNALEPIPGGPATMLPGDMTGKSALIDEAARAVADVRGMLFDDHGALRRGQAFKAQTNMPWSTGRLARQRIRLAVEASLRLTSGAAVPESEVERYTDMFTPSVMDDDQTAAQKMDSLTNFVRQSQANIATGRGRPSAQGPSAPASAPTSGGLPTVAGYDDYHALPSGAQYIDRYGRVRRKR